jgi:glycosyltransferase involved in cell wall biosynthesis
MHVSVVIPVYNEEKLIKKCLDSLTRQMRTPDEVYIVDNNSTDSSIEIARQYSFVTIVHESRQGICIAAKTGLDEAVQHEGILIRCDADCHPNPDWIEKIVANFNDSDDVAAVTGPGVAYDTNKIGQRLFDWFYMKPYFHFVGLALGNKPLFGSNFAIRSSIWKEISDKTHLTEHQDIHDDIDISYHIKKKGSIYYDSTLVMPISARPFQSFTKMLKRYAAGFRSIFIHWPEYAPWKMN